MGAWRSSHESDSGVGQSHWDSEGLAVMHSAALVSGSHHGAHSRFNLFACWEQKQAELYENQKLVHKSKRPSLTFLFCFSFVNKNGYDFCHSLCQWMKMYCTFR